MSTMASDERNVSGARTPGRHNDNEDLQSIDLLAEMSPSELSRKSKLRTSSNRNHIHVDRKEKEYLLLTDLVLQSGDARDYSPLDDASMNLNQNTECFHESKKVSSENMRRKSKVDEDKFSDGNVSISSSMLSPATKTINNLSQSQQTMNLMYDPSQLSSYDASDTCNTKDEAHHYSGDDNESNGDHRILRTIAGPKKQKIVPPKQKPIKLGKKKQTKETKSQEHSKRKRGRPRKRMRRMVSISDTVFENKSEMEAKEERISISGINKETNVSHIMLPAETQTPCVRKRGRPRKSKTTQQLRDSKLLRECKVEHENCKDVVSTTYLREGVDQGTSNNKETNPDTKVELILHPDQVDTVGSKNSEVHVYIHNYSLFFIQIKEPGTLGLNIGAAKPSEDLVRAIMESQSSPATVMYNGQNLENVSRVEKSMIVTGLSESSVGGQYGIKPGDWLFLCNNDRDTMENSILHLDYESCRQGAKVSTRPLTFRVARLLKNKCTNDNSNQLSESTSLCVTNNYDQASNLQQRKTPIFPPTCEVNTCENDKPAPFCTLCNQIVSSASVKLLGMEHHPWCSRNPSFSISGAKVILDQISKGMELQCMACKMEFDQGRMVASINHSQACRMNRKKINETNSQDKYEKPNGRRRKFKPLATTTLQPAGRSQQESQQIATNQFIPADEVSLSCYASSESEYQSERRGPIRQLVPEVNRRSHSKQKEELSLTPMLIGNSSTGFKGKVIAKVSKHRLEASCAREREVITQKGCKRTTKPSRVKLRADKMNETKRHSTKENYFNRISTNAASHVTDQEVDEDFTETLDIMWENCVDPWGHARHMDGDVVIFRSVPELSKLETINENSIEPRFAMYPFGANQPPRYQTTHYSPEEGFQSIILQRNTSSTLPWGFSVQMHEFGGACLVVVVDAMSPASSAIFSGLGPGKLAPLRVNDMIIEINGKGVGGMTMFSLLLELELCGPFLTLLISRYKFADKLQQQIRLAEIKYLNAVDSIVNNSDRLDWTDVGSSFVRKSESHHEIQFEFNFDQAQLDVQSHNCSDKSSTGEGSSVTVITTRSQPSVNSETKEELVCSFDLENTSFATDKKCESAYLVIASRTEIKGSFDSRRNKVESVASSSSNQTVHNILDDNSSFKVKHNHQNLKGTETLNSQLLKNTCHQEGAHDWGLVRRDSSSRKTSRYMGSQLHEKVSGIVVDERGCKTGTRNRCPENRSDDDSDEISEGVKASCVCGMQHSNKASTFWVQCDNCETWFYVNSFCVSFTLMEAPYIGEWTCPTCLSKRYTTY